MQNHINQVNRNEKLLSILDSEVPDDYFEWKIVIIFYSVLHIVSAYIFLLGKKKPYSHDVRNENLDPNNQDADYPIEKDAYDNYIDLYRLSKTCRYNGFKSNAGYIRWLQREYNLANTKYNYLKNHFKKEAVPI